MKLYINKIVKWESLKNLDISDNLSVATGNWQASQTQLNSLYADIPVFNCPNGQWSLANNMKVLTCKNEGDYEIVFSAVNYCNGANYSIETSNGNTYIYNMNQVPTQTFTGFFTPGQEISLYCNILHCGSGNCTVDTCYANGTLQISYVP